MATVASQNQRLLLPMRSKTLLGSVVTGQIAGLIMAVVFMVVYAAFLGKSPLYPVQIIGSALLGESALQGTNVAAILAGLVLHQAGPTLLWSLVFAFLAKKIPVTTTGTALLVGLGLGAVAMVGPYIVIPVLMKALQGADIWGREVPLAWDWAAHLIFGASFALYPTVREKLP